jgi:hypothetical protein
VHWALEGRAVLAAGLLQQQQRIVVGLMTAVLGLQGSAQLCSAQRTDCRKILIKYCNGRCRGNVVTKGV